MGRFNVRGLDRETGEAAVIEVTAISDEHAISEAGDLGLVVESVELIRDDPPAPPRPPATHAPARPPQPRRIPTYTAVLIAGEIYRAVGYVIGPASILVALLLLLWGDGPAAVAMAVAIGVGGVLIALLHVAAGQLLHIQRDMAINTWHIRQHVED